MRIKKTDPVGKAQELSAKSDWIAAAKKRRAAKGASTVDGTAAPVPTKPRQVIGKVDAPRGRLDLGSVRAKQLVDISIANLAEKYGVDAKTFVAHSVDIDDLGMTHIRLDRAVKGATVYSDQVIVHLAAGKGNVVTGVTGDVHAVSVRSAPRWNLTTDDIVGKMTGILGKEPAAKFTVKKVMADDGHGNLVPAYYASVIASPAEKACLKEWIFDAKTGEPIRQWEHLLGPRSPGGRPAGRGSPIGTLPGATPKPPPADPEADDQTLYSGKVKVFAKKEAEGWTLQDDSRGKGVITYDAMNEGGDKRSHTKFHDANNIWGEKSDPAREQGAVDAHYAAQLTYDAYKAVIGVDSFDLKGGALISNVHTGNKYDNAYWDGNEMNYGDGDGTMFLSLTSIDVGGHEITHGLTQHTAGLVYSGESGGLNEAFSDIGGIMVKWYAAQKNPNVHPTWAIGEDIWVKQPGALRYMDDPTKDGYSVDHYSKYPEQTEVHGSSGIWNNFFYQLCEPDNANKKANSVSHIAVKDGIGVEKGFHIVFDALRNYMTSNATFADAAKACVQSATARYGADSVEVKKVKEAAHAVGIEIGA